MRIQKKKKKDEITCVKNAHLISTAAAAAAFTTAATFGVPSSYTPAKPVRHPDHRLVRFDDNTAVLLNKKREMLCRCISGVLSSNLRLRYF